VLEVASVVGVSFDPRTLAWTLGRDPEDVEVIPWSGHACS